MNTTIINNNEIVEEKIEEIEEKCQEEIENIKLTYFLKNFKEISEIGNNFIDLLSEIDNYEIDNYEIEGEYKDLLDELYSNGTFNGSDIERTDPTAYRCGLNDYADSLYDNLKRFDSYNNLVEEKEELESILYDALYNIKENSLFLYFYILNNFNKKDMKIIKSIVD